MAMSTLINSSPLASIDSEDSCQSFNAGAVNSNNNAIAGSNTNNNMNSPNENFLLNQGGSLEDLLELYPSIDNCIHCNAFGPDYLYPCLFHAICQSCIDSGCQQKSCPNCAKCMSTSNIRPHFVGQQEMINSTSSSSLFSSSSSSSLIHNIFHLPTVKRDVVVNIKKELTTTTIESSVEETTDPLHTSSSSPSSTTTSTTTAVVEQQEKQQCAWCIEAGEKNLATLYCEECKKYFCHECNQGHQRLPISRGHRVTPLLHSTSTRKSSSLINDHHSHSNQHTTTCNDYCPLHNGELLNIYCDTCAEITCRNCQLSGTHTGHKHQWFEDKCRSLAGQLKRDLEVKFTEISDRMEIQIINYKNEVQSTKLSSKDALNDLTKHKQMIINAIENRFNEQINCLNDGVDEIVEHLTERQKQVQHYRRLVSHIERLYNSLCEPLLNENNSTSDLRDVGHILLRVAKPLSQWSISMIHLLRKDILGISTSNDNMTTSSSSIDRDLSIHSNVLNGKLNNGSSLLPVCYIPMSSFVDPIKYCNTFGRIVFLSKLNAKNSLKRTASTALLNNGDTTLKQIKSEPDIEFTTNTIAPPVVSVPTTVANIEEDNVTENGETIDINTLTNLQSTSLSIATRKQCCCVCGDSKNMIACTGGCYRLFHAHCHLPTVRNNGFISRDWRCTLCRVQEDSTLITELDRVSFFAMSLLIHPFNYLLRTTDFDPINPQVESLSHAIYSLPIVVKRYLLNHQLKKEHQRELSSSAATASAVTFERLIEKIKDYSKTNINLLQCKHELNEIVEERLPWFKGNAIWEKAMKQFQYLAD